jgi:hypothetical protein
MLGTQAQQLVGPQEQLTGPVQQQGGGLFGAIGSFFQQNPELAGSLAGAAFEGLVGGDVGIGAEQGLLGAQRIQAQRQQQEALEQRKIENQIKINEAQRKTRRDQEFKQQSFLKNTVEDFATRTTQMKGISSALSQGTAAGDIGAIFAYNKILDPGGRVTDKEVEIYQNAGLLNKGAILVDGVLTGVKLSPAMRRDLLRSASGLYRQAESSFDDVLRDQTKIAKREGFNIQNVINKPTLDLNIDKLIEKKKAFKDKKFFLNKGKSVGLQNFSTEAEIEAAGLKPGERGTLNGRQFVWE